MTKEPRDDSEVMRGGDMGTLEYEMKHYKTVERGACRDCGNKWWFDYPISYVCTTCAKTHGKNSSECFEPNEFQVKK